ncbi:hypothetical protein MN116_001332 [Schistosoma mekongi]|uniref:Transcription factor TFIIIC triple barrel domain-containing protein n=1 Tax=Schistosoma mekongi TaxID=38744 RepID=A0AAE2DAC5_SCHME|nr:hypothetical protein MN116_001332 [Schistosoma mekongi]
MLRLFSQPLIYGRFQILYATLKVLATFIDVLNYPLRNRLGILASDYSQSSGVTIVLSHVVSMLKYASTLILPMVVEILGVSFVYFCSTVLMKMAGSAYTMLFRIAFWILVSWEGGGSCHTIWKTMTSILTSGKLQKFAKSLPTLPEKSSTDVNFKDKEKSNQSTFSSSHSKSFGNENHIEQNLDLHLNNPNNVSGDWEIVSEEVLYVDCQGLLEDDILTPSSVIRLVDIESTKPLMQVGPAVFEGHYEDTVGTFLFFENSSPTFNTTLFKESVSAASVRKMDDQTPQHTTSYFTKSSKSLSFQRIFLKAKENG